ncbi:MAG: hypothetical protein HY052_09230 [Proteobacteria bacterium]|nr:hypothetical protein [Pseudomonadota bacterium]
MADMEDIAFGYPQLGCYARAHIMCRQLLDQGIIPKKAWAFEGGKGLVVDFFVEQIRWSYHVAPVVAIKMPDRTIQDMVMDPGLFDGPVPLYEWGRIMAAEPEKLQITSLGNAPKGYHGDYDTRHKTSTKTDEDAKNTMKEYLDFQAAGPRTVFPSQSRQQVQAAQVQKQGKTWVTMTETPSPSSRTIKPVVGKPVAAREQRNPWWQGWNMQ